MNEAFLSYVWLYRMYATQAVLSCGRVFSVDSPGMLNRNGGPDFLNARIRIDGTLWVGHVEIHVKSSDWYLHRHHDDRAYDTVVLHVVFHHDREVTFPDGGTLPVLALEGYLDPNLYTRYLQWMADPGDIACAALLRMTNLTMPSQWLIGLGVQRMMRKSRDLGYLMDRLSSDWQQMCYVSMCRSFGNKVNDDVFEMLALKTPYRLVHKYSNDPLMLEALLFGQSGLLELHAQETENAYVNALADAWSHIRYQHAMDPIPPHLWRFLRTRPANFPPIRIAQLACVLQRFIHVNLLDEQELNNWHQQLPQLEITSYWQEHFHFGRPGKRLPQKIGAETADRILINGIIPPLLRYGEIYKQHDFISNLVDRLAEMPAENNRIIRQWKQLNIHPGSALESQGAAELYNEYCRVRRCLECRFGQEVLKTGCQPANHQQTLLCE